MTREQVIHLLTFARVYDNQVTVGKAEAAAWFLAIQRVPFDLAQQAVIAHYTAPRDPGTDYPKIAPGHIFAYYQAHNQPWDKPVPAIEAPKCSPEVAARYKKLITAMAEKAAAKFAFIDGDLDEVPRWRPGMDKRKLALAQVEAGRNRRARGGAA